MRTILKFDMEKVVAFAQHARSSDRNQMTFEERREVYGEKNWGTPQHGEEFKARPKLLLVKDHGIYLMSSGHRDLKEGESHPVAYAEGFDPTLGDVYDACRDAVGGDDFAEEIPLDWVDLAVRHKSPEFRIEFGRDTLAVVIPDSWAHVN